MKALKEVIRPEARVCFLGPDSYGATGRVLQVHHHTVDVELVVPSSPNITGLLRLNAYGDVVVMTEVAMALRRSKGRAEERQGRGVGSVAWLLSWLDPCRLFTSTVFASELPSTGETSLCRLGRLHSNCTCPTSSSTNSSDPCMCLRAQTAPPANAYVAANERSDN